MNTLIVILCILLVIALGAILVTVLTKKSLNAALGSLLGLLGGLIASVVAPSLEGKADVSLHFGAFGQITATYLQVNAPQPTHIWYTAFITIGFLTLAAMWLVYDTGKRAKVKSA